MTAVNLGNALPVTGDLQIVHVLKNSLLPGYFQSLYPQEKNNYE